MGAVENFIDGLGGKPLIVYGLGRSGMSVVHVFAHAGATVYVGDDSATHVSDCVARYGGYEVHPLGVGAVQMEGAACLVLSPGIPLTHPAPHDIVTRAQAAGLEILCDIELFSRVYPDVKTVGITGTNGKSTSCALLHHVLCENDIKAGLAGNIGYPVFELDDVAALDWIVLELSSFQIDLMPHFRPDISAIVNFTVDHLDRHGSMERYMAVKARLFEPSGSDYNRAVICVDDDHTRKIFARMKDVERKSRRDVVRVSTDSRLDAGVYVADDILYSTTQGARVAVGDVSKLVTLHGIHNAQNVGICCAIAEMIGLDHAAFWGSVERFKGLNHRQFLVRTINGVTYVNDSKSTNAASAAVALECRNNVYWIVGGRKKKNGLEGLQNFFDHIKHVFLIGEASDDFAAWFDQYGRDYTRSDTLEAAVLQAHDMAQDNRGQPGGAGVVLLSPACASFDQYDSFEHRGDVFTDLVNALDE